MRRRFSFRDFGTGISVGLVVGSVGVAGAAFRYEGWARFSDEFKIGYVNGFLDMANLARNLEPGGYVDTKYPLFPQAKPVEWAQIVDRLYKDPENQRYRITSILQSAAKELEKKYGKPMDSQERVRKRMETQLAIIRKKQEAAGLKPAPPKELAAVEKKVPPAVAAKPPVASKPKEKEPRKWCRCDGKNPKVERAKRRAAAAAEQAAKASGAPPAAAPPSAPAAAPNPKEPATKP